MFIKTSKEFKEGVRSVNASNRQIKVAKEMNTVQKAWENTGAYIQKAVKSYGEKYTSQKY